jgi:uncharacterized protein
LTVDELRVPKSLEKNQIALFLILVTLFSALMWALIFVPSPFSGGGGKHYIEALMWCPALAAIASSIITQQGLSNLGLAQFGKRYALAGYLLPLAYSLIAYGLIWIFQLGSFPDRSAIAKLLITLGWRLDNPLLFTTAYFILMATTGMVAGTARSLGEEIGWRGFLAPRIISILGPFGGNLLIGIIWTLWHLPLILLGHQSGPTPLLFSLSCFTLFVVSSSFVLVWLRLKSKSVWPCALFHASHNVFIGAFFTPLAGAKGSITDYAVGEYGLALPLILIPLAFCLWYFDAPVVQGVETSEPKLVWQTILVR